MRRSYLQTKVTDSAGGYLADFTSHGTVVQRAYKTNTAALTVPDSHEVIALIMSTVGVRCQTFMITTDDSDGTFLETLVVSGRVIGLSAVESPYGEVAINVVDDKSFTDTMLGWQVPTAPITGQSAAEYAVYTGPVETRVKNALQANITRLGLPWDVVPTRGLGATGSLELRMHDMTSKIMPLLEAERLILSIVRQDTGRWQVDTVRESSYEEQITPASGVLVSWSWVTEMPTATRGVGGGRGEGTAREFKTVTDTSLEAALGIPLEFYIDCRQTDAGTDIAPQIQEELNTRQGRAGFTAMLRESDLFRFPDRYRIGTGVGIKVGAVEINDVVTQVEISSSAGQGFRVTPTVGLAMADPQQQLIDMVQKVSAQVRGLERR